MRYFAFEVGYINAMYWTDEEEHKGHRLARSTRVAIERDCLAFWQEHNDKLGGEGISEERAREAGRDFYLTRCGHGAGFWDGDWPEHGDTLTQASEAFGEVEPYVGDDGFIYIVGEENTTDA